MRKKTINQEKIYICTNCSREYDFKKTTKNGATTVRCSSCQVNIRKHANKIKALEYKGSCCQNAAMINV